MEYRILYQLDELEQAVDVQIAVWGFDPRWAVPADMMLAVCHKGSGGIAIGAFDQACMVGMVFGLPVFRGNQVVLLSHLVGVLPAYKGQGVGFKLKQMQRQWAIEHGYSNICWTFDPLQRGNANFNLHRLGTIAYTYLPNLYGEMKDEINTGMPSDRLEATWPLRDERVEKLAKGEPVAPVTDLYLDDTFLLKANANEEIIILEQLPTVIPWYCVEVPYSLKQLKTSNLAKALEWQTAVRQVLQTAFGSGAVAVDFVTEENRCWYVLRASR